MDLSNLKGYRGAVKKKRRIARGESSGWGCTAGRGHKGQKSRSGGNVRLGFEGGQMPLYRKLPKYKGFKSGKEQCVVISLSTLEKLAASEVDISILKKAGIVSKGSNKIKLLANGTIKKKVNIKVNFVSAKASEAIIKAGGKVELING
jgi:large subunit ribosomal protein L15